MEEYRTCIWILALGLLIQIAIVWAEDAGVKTLDDGLLVDRSKNEIKEEVSNEITTPSAVPLMTERPTTVNPSRSPHSGSTRSDCPRASRLDPVDQHLLDGILDIVDAKFSTLNDRLMTLERGMNNLQYYNIRSFRVVNTHLHAVDTILHSLGTQMNQAENLNIALEQSVGAIKGEIVDLQTTNNGVFQAIEQNLVHFHTDMQLRVTEVKQGIEQTNVHLDHLRNDTNEIRYDLDHLNKDHSETKRKQEVLVLTNNEILQTAKALINVSMSTFSTTKTVQKNTMYAITNIDRIGRNITTIASMSEEIRNGLSLVLNNMSSSMFINRDVEDETLYNTSDATTSSQRQFSFNMPHSQLSCDKLLEVLDEKLKHISVNLTYQEHSNHGLDKIDSQDIRDFKSQSKRLMRALSTVNENVYQSVTLYKHTGSLIERVVSDTEYIASEQLQLREELQAYLLNGTMELFNRSDPNFMGMVGRVPAASSESRKGSGDEQCSVSRGLVEELGHVSRNGSQLVELLTDLAVSSSATIRNSLEHLNKGINTLNKFQEEALTNFVANKDKAEAFTSRDDKVNVLKDIQNKTDLIYLFAEAIASNTGWIPFVYHRVTFVENQVNKTLNYLTKPNRNDRITRPSPNMAFIFKTKTSQEDGSDISEGDAASGDQRPFSNTIASSGQTVGAGRPGDVQDNMTSSMEYVYQTSRKLNRLIPALTTLLGEPEPYISLVDGASDREGRVEIYHKGLWGTLPALVNHIEASYICRKLGYLGGISAGGGHFGRGTGAFWNLNVTCLRTRWCNAITHLDHSDTYTHDTDAGVICDHMVRLHKATDEEEGEVTRHTGRLEIYTRETWTPVCHHGWGRRETSVACQQLGFREGAASGVTDALLDTNWVMKINCTGNETRLDACTDRDFEIGECPDGEYVSLICS